MARLCTVEYRLDAPTWLSKGEKTGPGVPSPGRFNMARGLGFRYRLVRVNRK